MRPNENLSRLFHYSKEPDADFSSVANSLTIDDNAGAGNDSIQVNAGGSVVVGDLLLAPVATNYLTNHITINGLRLDRRITRAKVSKSRRAAKATTTFSATAITRP